MATRYGGLDVSARKGGRWAAVLLALALAGMWGGRPASAEVVDSHVLSFGADPAYVNINFTTSISVTIGTSYGASSDNYTATVTKPSGSASTAWYNFSTLGTLSVEYGNASGGFMTTVDEVGSYSLRLEYFNGTAFTPAAYATLLVTDELIVVTEAATASNEYTDVHNCPIAQEFQRGGEVIARAYVTYASNGQFVNGTANPAARGNITGTIWGLTKNLTWQNVYHFWRAAFFPAWNTSAGVFQFYVDASDGKGNFGSGVSFAFGLTAWKIVPAILKVVPAVLNASGGETVLFRPGETVTIKVAVTYEGHKAHNFAFPGPLNQTRGGQVNATLGAGTFNTATNMYATFLANMTLTLDVPTQTWIGNYQVPANQANLTDVQARISATDGTNPPNAGGAFTTRFAIKATPAPQIIEVPNDIYHNATVTQSTGFEVPIVGGIAILLLAVGVGVGYVMSKMRKKEPPESREVEPEEHTEPHEENTKEKEGET